MTLTFRFLALFLLFAAGNAGAATGGERLGTLFYSPAERAALVSARSGDTRQDTVSGLRLGGIVKRAGGKGMVWINGQPLPEGQPVSTAPAPEITAQGATIDGKPVRVGETVNLVTGERIDIVPPGAVSSGKKK